MSPAWPAIPYDQWSATCDTLHAHTQLLGKLAVALAPAEPQLQHAALRLTARGWETDPLPAPDGSGSLVVALDLVHHEAVVETSGNGEARFALGPDRSVGAVTRDILAAVAELAGPVTLNLRPQEVSWTVELDRDEEHARYAAARLSQIGSGGRSERIRTYNFPQNRVTDHRIGVSIHNLPAVLEGGIGELIRALQQADYAERLATLTGEPVGRPRVGVESEEE